YRRRPLRLRRLHRTRHGLRAGVCGARRRARARRVASGCGPLRPLALTAPPPQIQGFASCDQVHQRRGLNPVDTGPPSPAVSENRAAPGRGAPRRVLIVEDHSMLAVALVLMLSLDLLMVFIWTSGMIVGTQ